MTSIHEKLLNAFHNYFFSRHREILHLEFLEPKAKRIKKAGHRRRSWPLGPTPHLANATENSHVTLQAVPRDTSRNGGLSDDWSLHDVTSLTAGPTGP